MPVLPFVPAIIQGGATIFGAKTAANSNTEAAKLQAATADKALAIQKQMYDQTRTDEAPYRAFGAGALGALSQGLGVAPTPAAPTVASASGVMSALAGAPHASNPNQQPAIGTAMPRPADQPVPPQYGVPRPAESQTAAQAQTTSGYVQMRSPTGQVKAVAPDQVAHYSQLGAQVI